MKNGVLINILTRTSGRPKGFYNCLQSVVNQKYKNIEHYVSYESERDLEGVDSNHLKKVKVDRYEDEVLINPEGHLHAPYNLYCNTLLKQVKGGWILFLDDDDHLLHNKVMTEVVSEIEKANEDTLFIWQMRYPDGKVLPTKKHFEHELVEFMQIGSPCFMFHSKYKDMAQWDQWKASDFRVVKRLSEVVPHKKWLERVYIQINNYGDFGNRNDIVQDTVTTKLIYNKTWYWYLIPKYHTTLNGVYIFQLKTYKSYWRRGVKKLQRIFKAAILC
ncbi:hypothetical protein KO566_11770 [Flavobacteriaceae bacterium XHP0103]|uniref:hypothetical protein n=1 Tax=Marixanthotalea marina TaxID=2844359 RepID=UPI002989D67C|nr:hypothetical protein [Marixanthotalea marina]MBU3822743.1 hypothetical protein [Marixanthotalea marina]